MRVLLLARPDSPLEPWLRAQGDDVVTTLEPVDAAFASGFERLVSYRYPRILPAAVLDRLPGAAVNLHISLLPWNRGSDPNFWSWVEGTPKGVTIHHMDPGVDTGDLIAQRELRLDPGGTLATTHAVLREEIEALFRESWPAIRAGRAPRTPQPPGGSFHLQAEAEALFPLLRAGWDTPVAELRGLRPCT